jgi:ATP-dependent protease Clp ATPase subunit
VAIPQQDSCAFCNKRADAVNLLIRGQQGVCICDACIMLCHEILLEHQVLGRFRPRDQETTATTPED